MQFWNQTFWVCYTKINLHINITGIVLCLCLYAHNSIKFAIVSSIRFVPTRWRVVASNTDGQEFPGHVVSISHDEIREQRSFYYQAPYSV